jgi:hypothetical protein
MSSMVNDNSKNICSISMTRDPSKKYLADASCLNKCSCVAQALGVTKFTNRRDMTLVTLWRAKSDLDEPTSGANVIKLFTAVSY